MAGAQKKARRQGRSLVLIDESGFMLQPVVRRTWAPVGVTPVHVSSARHDRLSVISALTVSPKRRRVGLYFYVWPDNISSAHAASFVRRVRRAVRRNVIVVWDRLNAHRTADRVLSSKLGDRVLFEYLPSYSPQLNPVESVWAQAKYHDLPNHLPDDIVDLFDAVFLSLDDQRRRPQMLRSLCPFGKHAQHSW